MLPAILFVGKANDYYAQRAAEYVEAHFPDHTIVFGGRGDAFPEEARAWRGDVVISYLSPWIIPAGVLDSASLAAINFHPGPPEYPGIGCTNFAIYDEADQFGVTCHHMNPKVDTGQLIAVGRFPLYPTDSVWTLTQRCYSTIAALFYEVADLLLAGEPLPSLDETWTRIPYTRKQLNDLCLITDDMDDLEVARRVRAVTFPGAPGAYREVDGERIEVTADVTPR